MMLKTRLAKTNIFLREHLTPAQDDIFFHARHAQKLDLLFETFTCEGRIYGMRGPDDRPQMLKSSETLQLANAIQIEKLNNPEYRKDREENAQLKREAKQLADEERQSKEMEETVAGTKKPPRPARVSYLEK